MKDFKWRGEVNNQVSVLESLQRGPYGNGGATRTPTGIYEREIVNTTCDSVVEEGTGNSLRDIKKSALVGQLKGRSL